MPRARSARSGGFCMASIDDRFGRLVITANAGKDKHGNRLVFARCDCGKDGRFVLSRLRSGETRSCGCLHRQMLKQAGTHKMTRTPTYRSWEAMRSRCRYQANIGFRNYGGRGIKVCDRWESFALFFEDMGARPPGMSLDRINPEDDYCPANCRWATSTEQNRNRRNNRTFQFKGANRTIPEIAEMVGLKEATLRRRLMVAGEEFGASALRPAGKRT